MRALALFVALVFGRVSVARAGGFEAPDQSATTAGTAGAATARHGDPSAAFFNPAALADGRGFRGAIGLLLAIPQISATDLEDTMQTSSTVANVSPPPHLHLSYAQHEWAVGAYVGVSHGTSVGWPEGWWGRFEAMSSSLLVVRCAPFFALRLGGEGGLLRDAPDIRFALGAHVDVARAETRRMLDFIDVEGEVHLLLWGAGVGGEASVYWQASPELAFGLAYKSRTWMRASGDADFTVPEAFLGRAPDQSASTELVLPDRLVLGAAWQQREFGLFLDLGYTAWSVRDRQRVDFSNPSTTDSDVAQHWHDTIAIRLGGEVAPLAWLRVRAGLHYDMEAAPATTLGPGAPDMARIGLGLGAGLDVTPQLGADLAYQYVALLGRESTNDPAVQDAPYARYGGEIHVLALTLRLALEAAREASAPPATGEEAAGPGSEPGALSP